MLAELIEFDINGQTYQLERDAISYKNDRSSIPRLKTQYELYKVDKLTDCKYRIENITEVSNLSTKSAQKEIVWNNILSRLSFNHFLKRFLKILHLQE